MLRVECFLADPQDFAAWNRIWCDYFAPPRPARTTVVAGFAVPGILIELQVTAGIDRDASDERQHVVVVGAGVAGLCCAYYLRRREYDVTVIESNRIGSGASLRTAAGCARRRRARSPSRG